MKYDVYGVGNALVDVQVQVTDQILTQTNFEKGIMTLVDDQQQQSVLQSITGLPVNRCAGGSAANTIVGVADLGGKTAYCGKVSRDAMGDWFLSDMHKLGVTMGVSPADEGPTGTCVVLITPDAQRTMVTNLGVSAILTPDDIEEDKLAKSKYVYLEGYLLGGDTTKAAVYKTIELALKHNVKIAFTASDPFLVTMVRDEIWELIKGPLNIIFCNEAEATNLTGKADAVDAAHEIHQYIDTVALTLGPRGSIIMDSGELIPIEGIEVEAIDTTGAGDMYAGGLLYGITSGMNWKQAGHLASHAAARIVIQLGARLERKFKWDEIRELFP